MSPGSNLEYGLILYLGSQRLKSAAYQLLTEGIFLLRSKRGVAKGVRYGDGGNYPVRADRHGYWGNGTHVNHRYTSPFDFFDHRCTATRAGSSGRCHDNGVYTGLLKLLSIFRSELFSIGDGGSVTDGGIEVIMQLAYPAFALKLAQNVNRQHAVRVFVCIYRVIAAVSGLILIGSQRLHARYAVFAIVRGG